MNLPDFPITEYLSQICNQLKNSPARTLILTAETGAGKSTILPLGLLENFSSKILMTEPRRIAVLGVANRISELLNEDCGKTVGYKIHLENKTSSATRLEIMTEAILVKILQENPTLDGYNIIVLDEAHERSVDFDLSLAFLKEAMQLRDDLYVIIMSATIDCNKLSKFMFEAPIMEIPGRTFPVDIFYEENLSIENAILREIKTNTQGNILVFLPGISDIRRCESNLQEQLNAFPIKTENPEILTLHSSVNIEQQKNIIKKSQNKRIILSSAIAETSLTIPDVSTVIDSGLARISKININTGMQMLVTEPESQFSAEQRKGRAGRQQKGKCIRLWNELDKRPKEIPPEILRTDLCELVLECADRGITNLSQIEWLDSPSSAEWKECSKLLKQLNLLNENFSITNKGKAALKLGMHPRLANLAIEGFYNSKNDSLINKLLIKYGNYEKSPVSIQNQFLNDVKSRINKIDYTTFRPNFENSDLIILAGFPDRLAKRISNNNDEKIEFQFSNGKKAYYYRNKNNKTILSHSTEWIVAPEVIINNGEPIIFDFEEISSELIPKWMQPYLTKKIDCHFQNGKIHKEEQICFNKLVISSKTVPVDESDYKSAWISEISTKGLSALPRNNKIDDFLTRTAFYYQQMKPNHNLEEDLINNLEEWLAPFITDSKLTEENTYNALYWYLEGNIIDKEVPQTLILENGAKSKIKYEKLASPDDRNKLVLRPVLEIIIQRIFGCHSTPKICNMNVLLRLLSPASRPLQITDDLENFWTTSWPEICKEMKGLYPKHDWNPTKN